MDPKREWQKIRDQIERLGALSAQSKEVKEILSRYTPENIADVYLLRSILLMQKEARYGKMGEQP